MLAPDSLCLLPTRSDISVATAFDPLRHSHNDTSVPTNDCAPDAFVRCLKRRGVCAALKAKCCERREQALCYSDASSFRERAWQKYSSAMREKTKPWHFG